jgi:hypothetical protein
MLFSSGCRKFGELIAIEDPGKVYIFGLPIFLHSAGRHESPEIFFLQFRIIRRLDKCSLEWVPFFENDPGRPT